MKRIIWILILAGLWFGCKPGVPSAIIRPDKMEKVLYDIHIADGFISTVPNVDSAKKVGSTYYNGIYKKFEIDSAVYARSMDYYYDHPELMAVMYKSISAKLKNEMSAIQKTDSLINAKAIKVQLAIKDRAIDSVSINETYTINRAERMLFLERYNDIYAKTAIIFNVLNIQKNKPKVSKVEPEPKPVVDSLGVPDHLLMNKGKFKSRKLPLPIQAKPLKIK
ncbi:DUF4296 domain-containing protein [Pedobacter changchengzhani]|uniref:DUF4296 domain-containing protein n=1 Tax=Pedobacter changchengzhani TaxID=2529274 RepID=A0A4R5MMN8_9SPHI|nr:DUF4296 domain-containing protein [Pedobacter changchengzhani]TDG36952.1 DUF4296 domain-containing protein [Pedobacter changchengzhani]